MENSLASIRILVVDDHKDWREYVRLALLTRPEWRVICEASDGLEAVQKAEELRPDLIVLDIGLPTLNGVEAARRVRQLSPNPKIIFLSMEHSPDVVQVALDTGAQGYVYKADAHRDLLPAIDAVLRGEQFVSSTLRSDELTNTSGKSTPHHHEVLFYSDDAFFLDSVTRFIATALEAGDAAIVLATQSHRYSLAQRLKAQGLDIDTALRQGTYLSLDVAETLSAFMVNDMPDPSLFFQAGANLITAAKKGHSRIVAFGECAPFLWRDGNPKAAIRLEQLWDQLAARYELDTLCAYALGSFHGDKDQPVFRHICAEHSAVYSQENR